MAIGTLSAIIKINNSQFESGINKSIKSIKDFTSTGDTLSGALKKITSSLNAAGAAFLLLKGLGDGIKKFFQVNGEYANMMNAEISGAKVAIDDFFLALGSGDWSNFFTNIQQAIEDSRELYNSLWDLREFKSAKMPVMADLRAQWDEAAKMARNYNNEYTAEQQAWGEKQMKILNARMNEVWSHQAEEEKRVQTDAVKAMTTEAFGGVDTKGLSAAAKQRVEHQRADDEEYVRQVLKGTKSINTVIAERDRLFEKYAHYERKDVFTPNGQYAYTTNVPVFDQTLEGKAAEQRYTSLSKLINQYKADINGTTEGVANQTKIFRESYIAEKRMWSERENRETRAQRYADTGKRRGRQQTVQEKQRVELMDKALQLEEQLSSGQGTTMYEVDFGDMDPKKIASMQKLFKEKFGDLVVDVQFEDAESEPNFLALDNQGKSLYRKMYFELDTKSMTPEQLKEYERYFGAFSKMTKHENEIYFTADLENMSDEELKKYTKELEAQLQAQFTGFDAYDMLANSFERSRRKFNVEGALEIDTSIWEDEMQSSWDAIDAEADEEIEQLTNKLEAADKDRVRLINDLISQGMGFNELTAALEQYDIDKAWADKIQKINEQYEHLYDTLGLVKGVFMDLNDALSAKPADNIGEWAAGTIESIIRVAKAYQAVAITKNGMLTFPENIIAISATVAAITSAINSFPKFSAGGVVPGNLFYGDRVLARLNSGERVLTREQNREYESWRTNGGGTLNIRLVADGRQLVGVIDNYKNYNATISKR